MLYPQLLGIVQVRLLSIGDSEWWRNNGLHHAKLLFAVLCDHDPIHLQRWLLDLPPMLNNGLSQSHNIPSMTAPELDTLGARIQLLGPVPSDWSTPHREGHFLWFD